MTSVSVNRIIIVVLDGVGAGELPDAADYGDVGSNTLVHVAQAVGGLNLPNLGRLGLGHIQSIPGVQPDSQAAGCFGRMKERSPGKDSITGHWEMMGIILERPLPTYPEGFPTEIIEPFEKAIGVKTIGNKPASGTEIIAELGEQHLRTGFPIVYTSADSVFQIAMHEDAYPIERQYDVCRVARHLLTAEHAVGRVICRPFQGAPGSFKRTERRKDFPLPPPLNTLDALTESGHTVHAIGKINEFFNSRGISSWDPTTNNADHVSALIEAARSNKSSLIFANLEDFDMLYGHRNDPRGFADALEEFDRSLPGVIQTLNAGDLLILTNDHGNDPTTPSTDHSREHAFLLTYGPGLARGVALGDRDSFADIGATIRQAFGLPIGKAGESFLTELRVAIP